MLELKLESPENRKDIENRINEGKTYTDRADVCNQAADNYQKLSEKAKNEGQKKALEMAGAYYRSRAKEYLDEWAFRRQILSERRKFKSFSGRID